MNIDTGVVGPVLRVGNGWDGGVNWKKGDICRTLANKKKTTRKLKINHFS